MCDRFDPAKDVSNRAKHKLSLAFGDQIFEDSNHLIIPSIRPIDGEERFKVIGMVEGKLFTASLCGETICLVLCPREGAIRVKKGTIALPSDPSDVEDFDAAPEALDRGQRARLIRKTRTTLGLSQVEFATRFHVPVGTLRDWEQARATAPDFAIAYIWVIEHHPDIVAETIG